MGHEDITLRGKGKNKQEAYRNALDDFFHENGHRYHVSEDLSSKKLRDVPPKKEKRTPKGGNVYITYEEDPTAPKSEWLEEWEFEIDFHV
jgi:hypothetical protein